MAQTNTVSVFVQMTAVTASGVANRPGECNSLSVSLSDSFEKHYLSCVLLTRSTLGLWTRGRRVVSWAGASAWRPDHQHSSLSPELFDCRPSWGLT